MDKKLFKDKELILRDELALDRTHLANERTILAYFRTSLTSFLVSLTLLKFFTESYMHILSIIFFVSSVFLLFTGIYRYFILNKRLQKIKK